MFRWIEQAQDVMQIIGGLERIFISDAEIGEVTRHNHHPF